MKPISIFIINLTVIILSAFHLHVGRGGGGGMWKNKSILAYAIVKCYCWLFCMAKELGNPAVLYHTALEHLAI